MKAGAALILIARIGRVLPEDLAWRVGRLLGSTFGCLPLRDVRRCREHLGRAFPERERAWVARTTRHCFAHFGGMGLWTLATLGKDQQRIARQVVVEDAATLRAVAQANRREGLIGFSGHFGNWELLARLAPRFITLTTIGRRMRSPNLDAFVSYLRTGTGAGQIYQQEGLRPCLRCLRNRHVLSTLIDQDIPALAGIFVPWFGIPAYTPSGPGGLVAATGAGVFSALLYRRAGRWVYHLSPIRRYDPSLGREKIIRQVIVDATVYQERLVRRYPEQWVWWHKRWRTRPEDRRLEHDGP